MTDRLAIDGGTPVRTALWPPWPVLTDAEIDAAEGVLRSGRISYWTGKEGHSLEREYAAYLGRAHAVALANGTVALELALRALGIGPGDEVVVPARSFIATASCAVAVGATPVMADIDPVSGNLTAATVAQAVTDRTAAVIPVHLGGWPVDMASLLELTTSSGLAVIEDCAQAHGASIDGRPVGSFGDAAAFSFCQDKIVTSGEGGLLATDDRDAYVRAWEYKDHGKSMARLAEPTSPGSGYRFLHDSFGSNMRLGEVESSMVRTQLARLSETHALRKRNALRLAAALEGLVGLTVPLPSEGVEHAFYRLYAHLEPEALAPGWDRDRVIAAIVAEGVPCQYGSCAELYRERAFVDAGLAPADRLPGAARAHATSLAFFVHPTISKADIDEAATAVRKVLEVAAR